MSLPSQDFYARLTPTELAAMHAKRERQARFARAAKPEPAPIRPVVQVVIAEPAAPETLPSIYGTATDLYMEAWRYLERMDGPPPKLTMLRIRNAVCRYYNVAPMDVLSNRRNKTIMRARQVAMWLAYKHTNMSFPEIGRAMKKCDHTSPINARDRIEHRRTVDQQLQADLDFLTSQLKPDSEAGV